MELAAKLAVRVDSFYRVSGSARVGQLIPGISKCSRNTRVDF